MKFPKDAMLKDGARIPIFTVYRELRRFNYQVDVSGMCNLHCISCPRGNWPRHRKPGFYGPLKYMAGLLTKFLRDDLGRD